MLNIFLIKIENQMKNSILLKIESWKKRNNITTKPLYIPLLESYRRAMEFRKGDFSSNFILLAYPSKVKQCKKWLIPSYTKETQKVLNWYKLTEEGKNVLQDLNKSIGWNKEMNDYFFNL